MQANTEITEAAQEYLSAHEIHYKNHDLKQALALYQAIVVHHPDSLEAKNASTQIQNIVLAVVPKETLFDAQLELALAHINAQG